MQYSLEKTVELPNAVVRIYRPDLTEEEKNKRQKNIHNSAKNLLRKCKK
jgi:hypothetical protein